MSQSLRRVVTTVGDDGRSHVASDGPSPFGRAFVHTPGYQIQLLGATIGDESHPVEPDRSLAAVTGMLPTPGGTRCIAVTMPPASVMATLPDPAAADDERRRFDPEFAALFSPEAPGYHATSTIDYVVVIDGQLWLELDDDEVLLRAGDVVVQNGTRHAWRNRSEQSATFFCVLVGVP